MEKAFAPVKAACALPCNQPTAKTMDAKTEREKRLAEALRQNLRRRKDQARGKDSGEPGTDDAGEPPSPSSSSRT
jgi:hypothetical protein